MNKPRLVTAAARQKTVEEQLAEHEVRLDSQEKRQDEQSASLLRVEDKLDGIKTLILGFGYTTAGLAATAAGTLLLFILSKAK